MIQNGRLALVKIYSKFFEIDYYANRQYSKWGFIWTIDDFRPLGNGRIDSYGQKDAVYRSKKCSTTRRYNLLLFSMSSLGIGLLWWRKRQARFWFRIVFFLGQTKKQLEINVNIYRSVNIEKINNLDCNWWSIKYKIRTEAIAYHFLLFIRIKRRSK